MAVFSPQPLKKGFVLFFFVKVTPPPSPQEESKCKNAQFLQWILKDDDVCFKKITASWIWGNSFIVKNIVFLHNMLPPPYCVTGPRWVKSTKPRHSGWWCADNIFNAFTWMKIYLFWFKCHCDLFLWVQLTFGHSCFRWWLSAEKDISIGDLVWYGNGCEMASFKLRIICTMCKPNVLSI